MYLQKVSFFIFFICHIFVRCKNYVITSLYHVMSHMLLVRHVKKKTMINTYRVWFHIWHQQRVSLDLVTAREFKKNCKHEETRKRTFLQHF